MIQTLDTAAILRTFQFVYENSDGDQHRRHHDPHHGDQEHGGERGEASQEPRLPAFSQREAAPLQRSENDPEVF